MQFLASVIGWLADPAHWQGTDGIPNRVVEHLWLSGLAVLVAVLLAAPFGVWLGHRGRGGFLAVNVTNLGRALPSMALLAFALPLSIALGLGLGFWPTLVALIPLGIPPILTNSYTAVHGVDPDVVEAGRGMGLSEWQVLRGVELPLGALVAGGGLGRYIVDGLALQDYQRLFVGALLVALLAIVTELLFGLLERAITSPEVRGGREQTARPATA